jgi:hypothetical protein
MTMKFVRAFCLISSVSCVFLASATNGHAARLFFSTVDDTGSPIADSTSLPVVPTVNVDANGTGTLHIWMQVDVQPPSLGRTVNGLSYDIQASNALATPTGHTIVNPDTMDGNGDPAKRWDGTGPGYPGEGDLWVKRSVATAIAGTGIGNRTANLNNDPMTDTVSRAFYVGSLTFTAGTQSGMTGLYFRVGEGATTFQNPAGPAPLQFGSGTATYQGDAFGQGNPITQDLAQADAIINIMGGTEPTFAASITAHAPGATDPNQLALLDGSPKGTFVDLNNVTSGRININNFIGEPSGNLTVFFDLVNDAQAAQLVTDLNAIPSRTFTAALSNFVGTNPSGRTDGDIALTFTGGGAAGSSQYVDFNFGTVQAQAVGIPEPSTYALASLALMATAVYARRRRAA